MLDRREYIRTASALGLASVVAGCSGGDEEGTSTDGDGGGGGYGGARGGDDGGGSTDSEATHGDAVTPTGDGGGAQSAYPDYNWEQLEDASATEATTVTMVDFAYDPLVARVPAGEAVSFPNEDGSPHTVTIPAVDVDKEVSGGGETTVTIEEPGTYDYVCRFHPPSMLGRLVVE